MDPLRLLVAAAPDAAHRAVTAVREGGPVEAALAPTAESLRAGLADGSWHAVAVVPGGPIADADLVTALTGASVPVVIVGPAVPPALEAVATFALVWEGLEAFSMLVGAMVPEPKVGASHPEVDAPRLDAPADPFAHGDGHPAPSPEVPAASPAPPPAPAVPGVSRIAEHLPIGVYRSTPDGRILSANPALAHLLGAESVEALASIDVRRDLGYPREAFAEHIRRHGEVRNLVVTWVHPSGQTVHTRENARGVTGPDGAVQYFEGTMEDVTAEVEAQAAERRRARQHAAVAHIAGAADSATTVADLHRAAADALLAATGADAVLLIEHAVPGDGPLVGDAAHNRCVAVAGAVPPGGTAALDSDPAFASMTVLPEAAFVRDAESGSAAWLPPSVLGAMRAAQFRGVGCFPLMRAGTPLGAFILAFRDPHTFSESEQQVAEALAWHLAGHLARFLAERDLRDTEASLRFIAEHTGQVLYRLRYAGAPGAPPVFDYLSPAVEALTGYDAETLAAAGGFESLIEHREVLAGEGLIDGPLAADPAREAAATSDPCEGHYLALYRLTTRDGQTRWVENNAYPWCDRDQPVGLVGVMHDVTERRRVEASAADAAQQLLLRQGALVDLTRSDDADAAAFSSRVAEVACDTTTADAASVWLREDDAFVCRAACAPGAAHRPAGAVPSAALEAVLAHLHGHRTRALDTPEALAAAGYGPLVAALAVPDEPSLVPRTVLAAPIRRRGATVGLLVLHATASDHAWTDAEADHVAALADTLALALERRERARAEAALRESEARYRALSDLSSDYTFAVRIHPDGSREVAWATDAFERLTGYGVDHLLDPARRGAIVCPDSLRAAHAALDGDDTASGGLHTFEIELRARDGQTRWIAHRTRLAEAAPDGSALVYHSGQDVSERKHALAAIETARAQAEAGRAAAEELTRLKSAFLANMSHEIRTPLTSILGYSELLAAEVADDHRDFVEQIARGGRRLLDTLNSVLDLARLESREGLRPEMRRISVGEEVRRVVEELAVVAAENGLSFEFGADADAEALLDPACLARVTSHLVANALKFTPTGGRIAVRVTRAADAVVLRVADTGIGIAPDFLPHLFDEFRQEEAGDARSHEGSGLGLAITQRLVALMNGTITVESRRPGGSTFTVSFPAAPPVAPPPVATPPVVVPHPLPTVPSEAPAAPAAPPLAMTDPTLTPGAPAPASSPWTAPPVSPTASPFEPFAVESATPPASGPASPAVASTEGVMLVRPAPPPEPQPAGPDAGDDRASILVVEDNADTRMLLERILRASYRVTAVGDARSALVEMNRQRFHGFVLDINLGGKETGTDVLRVARTLEGYASVFAMALTAYALPGDRERLLEAGFDEYLSKPFTRQALLDALATGVRR